MSVDSSVNQSLQEIASLLLLIHDCYLNDSYGSDVLNSLINLVFDTGLDNIVSILDIEYCRTTVMNSTDVSMGYDLFYNWLRNIAHFVYKRSSIVGKKALHRILIEYIIPFASQLDGRSPVMKSRYSTNLSPSFLRSIMNYSEFVTSWFYLLLMKVSA